jgi:hypothetical protein
MTMLLLISLTLNRKIVAIGIVIVTLIQTSNIFLPLYGVSFPLKGLVLSGICVLFTLVGILFVMIKPDSK